MEINRINTVAQQLKANNINTSKNLVKQQTANISFGCGDSAIPWVKPRMPRIPWR